MLIEQRGERAQDAALGLPAKSEQDEVLPGENCVDDLRDDGVLVADDAGEDGLARLEPLDQIFAELVLDGAFRDAGWREFFALAKISERLRKAVMRHVSLPGSVKLQSLDQEIPDTRVDDRASPNDRYVAESIRTKDFTRVVEAEV